MSLVMLKHTSNPKYQHLIGRVGDLTFRGDGTFAFSFTEPNGSLLTLQSGVTGRLGDLDDLRCKEVNIRTRNSSYDFEKMENVLEEAKLFSGAVPSMDARSDVASQRQDAMRQAYGKHISTMDRDR